MNDRAELTSSQSATPKAWCSQDPEKVAAFFAERGSISINDGPPAVGRAAIAREAQAFMTTFPDMVVTFDKLEPQPNANAFHWTLTGTNTGPGGRENAFVSAATNFGRSTTTDSSQNQKAISTAPSTNVSSAAGPTTNEHESTRMVERVLQHIGVAHCFHEFVSICVHSWLSPLAQASHSLN